MRFQYLLCLSFLAAAIKPALSLPIVSSHLSPSYEARNADEDADLLSRDSFATPGYKVKPLRQKKTAAQVNQRKELARQDAQKNNKLATPKGPKPQNPKAHTTQQAALARKNDRLQRGRNKFQAAAKAHKDTVGLPDRKERFNVPGEHAIRSGTYSGKDVRIANFNSHLFKNNKVNNSPQTFHNNVHKSAQKAKIPSRPIPNMQGKGHEFPLTSGSPKGYRGGPKSAARLITQNHTQEDGKQVTKFVAVVAHRGGDSKDHFQVHQELGNGGVKLRESLPNPRLVKAMVQLPFHPKK